MTSKVRRASSSMHRGKATAEAEAGLVAVTFSSTLMISSEAVAVVAETFTSTSSTISSSKR